jgi:hypothetical protein
MMLRGYRITSQTSEVISQTREVISRMCEVISHACEVISYACEMIPRFVIQTSVELIARKCGCLADLARPTSNSLSAALGIHLPLLIEEQ